MNNSVNVWQYSEELGGVTFWDYFASEWAQGVEEDWESSHYGWQDVRGEWQRYRKEIVKDGRNQDATSYVIVDRHGTGVTDKMVFIHDSPGARPKDHHPDLLEWGYLGNLGMIRIEVDESIAYEVPIEDYFSGKAMCLSPDLARLFFWRYSDFGSIGSIMPTPYQNHIKISVYGGIEKPRWFTVTGTTLAEGTRVKTFSGCLDESMQDSLKLYSLNVTKPENYLDNLNQVKETMNLWPKTDGKGKSVSREDNLPSQLRLEGAGTINALQFRVPKNDVSALDLKVKYGRETAIDMPLLAFFSDQDRIIKHRSTPVGVIDDPQDHNSYLFYSNYPLPYQDGITIELATRSQPQKIQLRYARSSDVQSSQFRVDYDDFRSHPMLQPLGPDYTVTLPGNGKLVGVVLTTRDYKFDLRSIPAPPTELAQGTSVFPMGYMESNVTLKDGTGVMRVYSGLEDFADAGYVFGSDEGPGKKNLFFAGVLAFLWDPPERGYLTIFRYFNDLSAFRFKNGLRLAIQHGTWKNNFPVRYGHAVFYYSEVRN